MADYWTITDRKTLKLTKKDTSHPKTKEKLQWNGRRRTFTIKSNSITAGCMTQNGEHLYHRSPLIGVKVLSPTSGFPTWGSGNRRRNSQRIRLWRLTGFDCRILIGLGKRETPLLEGTQKVVCTSGPRGRSSDPIRNWATTTCYCWRISCRGSGWLWLIAGTRTLAVEVLGTTRWHEPSWSQPFDPPTSL